MASGQGELTYADVGATAPGSVHWTDPPAGYRVHERTATVGSRPGLWEEASGELLPWGVKRRSGFAVEPGHGVGLRVERGADYRLVASVGPVKVWEPVRVIAVVDQPDRRGFAYGTLTGHPVSGEEAFVLHRTPDGEVRLTLRSLTRPAPQGAWRILFPALLVAQRFYRRRYLRAFAG